MRREQHQVVITFMNWPDMSEYCLAMNGALVELFLGDARPRRLEGMSINGFISSIRLFQNANYLKISGNDLSNSEFNSYKYILLIR